MEENTLQFNKPTNRQAGLNQAAYLMVQTHNRKTRRENLMKNISDTERKLERLEGILSAYKEQLASLDTLDEAFDKQIKEIQGNFDLTMAEILETKSSILRNQIETLKRQSELAEKDQPVK